MRICNDNIEYEIGDRVKALVDEDKGVIIDGVITNLVDTVAIVRAIAGGFYKAETRNLKPYVKPEDKKPFIDPDDYFRITTHIVGRELKLANRFDVETVSLFSVIMCKVYDALFIQTEGESTDD